MWAGVLCKHVSSSRFACTNAEVRCCHSFTHPPLLILPPGSGTKCSCQLVGICVRAGAGQLRAVLVLPLLHSSPWLKHGRKTPTKNSPSLSFPLSGSCTHTVVIAGEWGWGEMRSSGDADKAFSCPVLVQVFPSHFYHGCRQRQSPLEL